MSAGVQRREIARRVFAAEFGLADESIRIGAGERAPTYVVSPGGAWMNRIFSVGVLTEQTDVSAGEMIRARIADPTGAIVTYAGQYQPAAAARLDQASVGSMIALTGKARTYQPDDGDAVYTSVRPETVTEVDAQTQQQWIVDTAIATLQRVDLLAPIVDAAPPTVEIEALAQADGIDDQVLGAVAAHQRYHPGIGFLEQLRVLAMEALAVVAGDRDTISDVTLTIDTDAATIGEIPPTAQSPVDVEAVLTTIASVASDSHAGSGMGAPVVSDPGDSEPPQVSEESEESAPADEESEEPVPADRESEEPAPADEESEEPVPADRESEEPVPADRESEEPLSASAQESGSVTAPTDTPAVESTDDADTTEAQSGGPSVDTDPSEEVSSPSETSDAPASAPTAEPDPSSIEAEVEQLGEFELGEDTRAALEEEFDTGFTTGAELDAAAATDDSEGSGPTDSVELVITAMNSLDDGDGAPTEAVIDQVVSESDMDRTAVESAIEEALMGGRCYESAEGRLTAI